MKFLVGGRLLAWVALIFAAILTVAPGDPVFASCAPNRLPLNSYYFDGYYQSPGYTVQGLSTQYWEYQPYVYPNSYSTAYVMISASGCSTCNYAQVGWAENGTGYRYTYAQWYDPTAPPGCSAIGVCEVDKPAQPLGQFTTYNVKFNASLGTFNFFVAGMQLASATAYFTPITGQVYGETGNQATQMPGGVYNHEAGQSTVISYSGSSHDFIGTPDNQYTAFFGESHPVAQEYDVWDKYCSN